MICCAHYFQVTATTYSINNASRGSHSNMVLYGGTAPLTKFMTAYAFFSKITTH